MSLSWWPVNTATSVSLASITKEISIMSASLTALTAAFNANIAAVNSAITLLNTLASQVAALNANNNDASLQPAIDALTASVTAGTANLVATLATDGPAAPVPTAA